MQVTETQLADVKLLRPQRFGDSRGWFAEVFNERTFAVSGLPVRFVQDNQSMSRRGVLRGLHYQLGRPQGKLVRVLRGHIWDVAVDLRPGSATFARWTGTHLRPANDEGEIELLWIPEGFAHGFLVISDEAEVLYKTTDFYVPAEERCIVWDDPELRIGWPLDLLGTGGPEVSEKDAHGRLLREAELPRADVQA